MFWSEKNKNSIGHRTNFFASCPSCVGVAIWGTNFGSQQVMHEQVFCKYLAYPSRPPEFTPGFWWGRCCSSF